MNSDRDYHPFVIVDWSTGRELARADDEQGAETARFILRAEDEAKDIRWTCENDG